MAQKVVVSLVDDIDGGVAEETVEFALDGRRYEIDLSDTNAKGLRDVVAPYLASARRASGGARGGAAAPRRQQRPAVDKEQNTAIRNWARQRGLNVSDRGRIPSDVVEAFHKEHAPAS